MATSRAVPRTPKGRARRGELPAAARRVVERPGYVDVRVADIGAAPARPGRGRRGSHARPAVVRGAGRSPLSPISGPALRSVLAQSMPGQGLVPTAGAGGSGWRGSHSGRPEPLGTSTGSYRPGVPLIRTWSVTPW